MIGLLLRFLDEEFREDHAARFVVGMRQRQKAGRPELLFLNFLRRQGGEFLPGHATVQLDAHAILNRRAARHCRSLGRPVSEVIALCEQGLLALCELRFLRLKTFCQRGEVFDGGSLRHTYDWQNYGDTSGKKCFLVHDRYSFRLREGEILRRTTVLLRLVAPIGTIWSSSPWMI